MIYFLGEKNNNKNRSGICIRFWKGPSHYRIINDIYKKQKNEKQHSKVAADDDDDGGKRDAANGSSGFWVYIYKTI